MRKALILLLLLFLVLSVWAYVFNDGEAYDFETGYKMLAGKLQLAGEFSQDVFKLFEGDFTVFEKWFTNIGKAIASFVKNIWDSLWGAEASL